MLALYLNPVGVLPLGFQDFDIAFRMRGLQVSGHLERVRGRCIFNDGIRSRGGRRRFAEMTGRTENHRYGGKGQAGDQGGTGNLTPVRGFEP